MAKQLNRRQFMGKSLLASGGVAAGLSFERQALLAMADQKKDSPSDAKPLTGLPKGRIGKLCHQCHVEPPMGSDFCLKCGLKVGT